MRFYTYFNPGELRKWIQATMRLETYAKQEWDNHPRRCALRYAILVRRNIASQKHMGNYPAYVTRYARWKENFGRLTGYWKLFGDLMNNITHWRTLSNIPRAKAWMGGIPGHVVDSGGKSWFSSEEKTYGRPKPIAMYGRVMEFGGRLPRGGGTHPERPIFNPSRLEFAEVQFVDLGARSLHNVSRAWR